MILDLKKDFIGKNHFSISWRATCIKRVVIILHLRGLVIKYIARLRVVEKLLVNKF